MLRISILSLFLISIMTACTPPVEVPLKTSLLVYHTESSKFVEYSSELQPIKEIPFTIPLNCGLFDTFPAPIGKYLLIELSCPNGQTVIFLDTESGSVSQPVTDSDAHFLAWTNDGASAYLKVDSLGNAHVIRAYTNGKSKEMELTGWTYDLAAAPTSDDLIFSFSRGLGAGSEMNVTLNNGRSAQNLYTDKFNYIAFSRYSPDGRQITFLKIPDSSIPFTIGELWVMNADGSAAHKLADADAGHGYAANWSPDGTRIAFVKRENPQDESANQSTESLISNVYVIEIDNGNLTQITQLTDGQVETPHWSPDGNSLAFNEVVNGRMEVQIADMTSGEIQPLITSPTCCPAWMLK